MSLTCTTGGANGLVEARATETSIGTVAKLTAPVNIGTSTFLTASANSSTRNTLRLIGSPPAFFELFLDLHGKLTISPDAAVRTGYTMTVSSQMERGAINPNVVVSREIGNLRAGAGYSSFVNTFLSNSVTVWKTELEPDGYTRNWLAVRIPFLGDGMNVMLALNSRAQMDGRCVIAPFFNNACIPGTDTGAMGVSWSEFGSTLTIRGGQMLDANGNIDREATSRFEFASDDIFRGNPFVVSRVPEPSSLALLTFGGLMLTASARRRRREEVRND